MKVLEHQSLITATSPYNNNVRSHWEWGHILVQKMVTVYCAISDKNYWTKMTQSVSI